MSQYSPKQIATALRRVKLWTRHPASIERIYEFKDFPAAVAFVNDVAALAESAWHHPDIDIRWNKVALRLTTHDEGGLTRKDFTLAAQFDLAARRVAGKMRGN